MQTLKREPGSGWGETTMLWQMWISRAEQAHAPVTTSLCIPWIPCHRQKRLLVQIELTFFKHRKIFHNFRLLLTFLPRLCFLLKNRHLLLCLHHLTSNIILRSFQGYSFQCYHKPACYKNWIVFLLGLYIKFDQMIWGICRIYCLLFVILHWAHLFVKQKLAILLAKEMHRWQFEFPLQLLFSYHLFSTFFLNQKLKLPHLYPSISELLKHRRARSLYKLCWLPGNTLRGEIWMWKILLLPEQLLTKNLINLLVNFTITK